MSTRNHSQCKKWTFIVFNNDFSLFTDHWQYIIIILTTKVVNRSNWASRQYYTYYVNLYKSALTLGWQFFAFIICIYFWMYQPRTFSIFTHMFLSIKQSINKLPVNYFNILYHYILDKTTSTELYLIYYRHITLSIIHRATNL